MNTAHFQHLPEHLCSYLSEAKRSVCVAICWFSHRDIFDILLERLRHGVHVELLLEYDSQNIRDEGLDFQQFVRMGGQLWACREAGLMHHKFAIVDNRLLLTGSFNWTYNSNAENLLITDDTFTLAAYQEEFDRQKVVAKRIFQLRRADVKIFSAFPLFEKTLFPLADLRKNVSCGANVWLVRLNKLKIDHTTVFSENRFPFDSAKHLSPYWSAYRMWDEVLFDEEMERLQTEFPDRLLRDLRCWARRMKIGDLVFATDKANSDLACQLIAVGVVQSHPQMFSGEGFSSFRSVQWLKIIEEMPYLLSEKTSGQVVTRYHGSALRVLQEVFEE